jgi:hypothetical protein
VIRRRLEGMSTSTLLAFERAIDRPVLRYLFADTLMDVQCELLERELALMAELARLADEAGPWPAFLPPGVH